MKLHCTPSSEMVKRKMIISRLKAVVMMTFTVERINKAVIATGNPILGPLLRWRRRCIQMQNKMIFIPKDNELLNE